MLCYDVIVFKHVFFMFSSYLNNTAAYLQAYAKLTIGNLVQYGFPTTINVYLTHDNNGILLPKGCNETEILRFGP